MATAKFKTFLSDHKKMIALLLVVVLAVALALSFFLKNDTKADEGNTIPDTAATKNSDGVSYLRMVGANLVYQDEMLINYAVAVNTEALAGKDYKVKMLFWDAPQNEYVKGESEGKNDLYGKLQGLNIGGAEYQCAFFVSDGIEPKKIGDTVYARAYIELDGEIYYSNAVKYSVLDYVYSRFDQLEKQANNTELSDDQKTKIENQLYLYSQILQYGANAQTILGYKTDRLVTLPAVRINVATGYSSDGFKGGTYLRGDTVKLVADYEKNDMLFAYWMGPNGETVSYDIVYEFEVDADTVGGAYTAVYNGSIDVKGVNAIVVSQGKEVEKVASGSKYFVKACPAEEGKIFKSWKITNADGEIVEHTYTSAVLELTAGTESYTYEASFVDAGTAEFAEEGLPTDGLVKDTHYKSGEYDFVLGVSGEKFGAKITVDPKDDANSVLLLEDNNFGMGGGLYFTAKGDGEFYVLSFKMLVHDEDRDGGIPLQIQFNGETYMLQFSALENVLKVYDRSGSAVYLGEHVEFDKWNTFKIVVTNKSTFNSLPRAYIFVNDACVVSYNVPAASFTNSGGKDAVTFYALYPTTTQAYIDNVQFYKTNINAETEKGYNASEVESDRFENAEIVLDNNALEALKEMDKNLFSEAVYEWAAELYDPETGAFYFSISGRDNYGYLPDIETTAQMSGVLENLGIGSLASNLNAEQKAKLGAWIQSLQSNRDGYYYHPHWGINIGNSRLSRDLSNSSTSFSAGGVGRLYDDANFRLSSGAQGNKGTTVMYAYDAGYAVVVPQVAAVSYLTEPLTSSVVKAVSKVVLTASTSVSESSMPVHLRSEQNLITYINTDWNKTCSKEGVHERHFCTDACKDYIVKIEDKSDSRMYFENGKLVITREEKCTRGHECTHTSGHSYAFGHGVTSMGAQIRSAGLGDATVLYFRDIQENVQQSLIAKGKTPNGLWEEEITYGTISGLLKISGIPTAHRYEFLYAEEAINSAIQCALTDLTAYGNESIVSIYNPFNAINGIMGNLKQYGSNRDIDGDNLDKFARIEAIRDLVRSKAADLISISALKLAKYKMPDGGYSYSMDGYCTTSQGQPVAIDGWNDGIGEGDVNGTALAFGTRSALLSALGISVTAPFSGSNADVAGGYDLNNDGDLDDEFDLDGDGKYEIKESELTHKDRFRYIITTKNAIKKIGTSDVSNNGIYDFEDGKNVGYGTVVDESGNEYNTDDPADVNHVGKYVDAAGDGYKTVSFGAQTVYVPLETVGTSKVSFRMKVGSNTTGVTHQISVKTGGSTFIFIDMNYDKNGRFKFVNNIKGDTDGDTLATGIAATSWFTVEIVIGTDGNATFNVTPDGGETVSKAMDKSTFCGTYGGEVSGVTIASLNATVSTFYFDDVKVQNYDAFEVVAANQYLFDTEDEKAAYGANNLVLVDKHSADYAYVVDGKEIEFGAKRYLGSRIIYNFNSLHLGMYLPNAKVGQRVDLNFMDASGKVITGAYLVVEELYVDENKNPSATVGFYAVNGQPFKAPTYNENNEYVDEDLKIKVDPREWITVKLEFHHDMSNPQLDLVVKYANAENKSYLKTVAATLNKVRIFETGADAYNFLNASINSSDKIYIDDMYVRNVRTKVCEENEHNFVQIASDSYLAGTDGNGHSGYYMSCKDCGEKDTDTSHIFYVCEYEKKTVDSALKTPASSDTAAIYYLSCKHCGETTKNTNGETFTHGMPLKDESKWNFDEESGQNKLPVYLNIVQTYITDSNGKTVSWDKIVTEDYNGNVNSFLTVGKESFASETPKITIQSNEAGADKYVYEFLFRWQGASNHVSGIIYLKSDPDNSVHGQFIASADGEYASYNGVNFHTGEWHAMRYEYTKSATDVNKWDVNVFIDGEQVQTFSYNTEKIPYLTYELRYSQNVDGHVYTNDMIVDFDAMSATAIKNTEGSAESGADTGSN